MVEDEERLRRIIVRTLSRRGFEVWDAGTVADALTCCRTAPMAVLVLDVQLPDGSAWDVLAGIDACARPHVAVVLISAAAVGRARSCGFASATFLAKPFAIPDLIDAVERATADAACGG